MTGKVRTPRMGLRQDSKYDVSKQNRKHKNSILDVCLLNMRQKFAMLSALQ